jgi:hypothetical protein
MCALGPTEGLSRRPRRRYAADGHADPRATEPVKSEHATYAESVFAPRPLGSADINPLQLLARRVMDLRRTADRKWRWGARPRLRPPTSLVCLPKAKTEKAIKAFADITERLDTLAAERARPWRRRLSG